MRNRSNRSERALRKARRIFLQHELSLGQLFRGPTPKKILQTIDIGTNEGYHFHASAKRNPDRQYLSIDPAADMATFKQREMDHKPILVRDPLSNVERLELPYERVLPFLIKKGIRTRHINIDMPTAAMYSGSTNQDKIRNMLTPLLQLAPHLLLVNGKIFITTEYTTYPDEIRRMAHEMGYSVRIKKDFRPKEFRRKSDGSEEISHAYNRSEYVRKHSLRTIYRIELTYGLKKAAREKMMA